MTQNSPGAPPNPVIEQYKAYMQDVANIGVRHETARQFYLGLVSALFVLLSLAGKDGLLSIVHGTVLVLVGVTGIFLSGTWWLHMGSFAALYRAKFTVLRQMEQSGGLHPIYANEWDILKTDRRYLFLTAIDRSAPVLFIALFSGMMCLK